jgi:predicted amidohydrolase YtcJ
MTIEEALRGWTIWSAYAEFREQELGAIATGRIANLTAMNIDPFQVGEKDPARLLEGKITMTIVGGKVKSQQR